MFRHALAALLIVSCAAGCSAKTETTKKKASGNTEYALTDKPGRVSPDTQVNLPGGKGAFPTTVDTGALTGATASVTVTAGYAYSFQCVIPGSRAKLSFAVANPIPGGDSVRATITERVKNFERKVIFSRKLPRTPKGHKVVYTAYTVPLPASDDCMEITLWTKADTGGVGAWAMFVGPTVKGLPES